MFNLYSLFKSNSRTKQGKVFTSVVAAIQGVVILVIVAEMVAYVLTHGGF